MTIDKHYHLIGLGGIGMSAIARILLQKGCDVQGSDQTASFLLEELQNEGARVEIGHRASGIKSGANVVYSSGIREENEELMRAKELGLSIFHRSDLLDQLMQGKQPLLVTGTHGKTTTSALLASVCMEAQLDPSFALGGILRSLNTNGRAGSGSFFIAEADESDGSFLKTASFGAIVTNLDTDHLDYWKSQDRLNAAFEQFFARVQHPAHLFWCCDDPRLSQMTPAGYSYGFSKNADVRIESFDPTNEGIVFDLMVCGRMYRQIFLPLFGRHNALNGSAVFALALSLQIPELHIRSAFQRFSGVKRRLEFKGEAHRVWCFDDYAHHPVEIQATLRGLRDHIRERRLVVVFQPHRYTRVRDVFDGFLHCFCDADVVVLTDIYSAGEPCIEGVSSAALYTRMKERLGGKLHFFPRSHLESGTVSLLHPLDVVLTIGAGDVTRSGELILKRFAQEAPKIHVVLMCGGTSAEHEVSVSSAINVAKGLDPAVYHVHFLGLTKKGQWSAVQETDLLRERIVLEEGASPLGAALLEKLFQCDVVLPVFHGPQGEDGMIQGFLDTLQIPYAGCDYRSGALCMHKGWTKQIALMNQMATPSFLEMEVHEYRADREKEMDRIAERLRFPVWVKPAHLGSSVGVSRANRKEEVEKSLDFAFFYDDCVIIEEHIEGRQIEFGVMGNEYIRVGPPCEILNHGAFVDYAGKYGASAMGYAIPARLSDTEAKMGMEMAKRLYQAARCKGLARIDFFLDRSGRYWLNEINPFPGCTDTSAFPKIWAAAGVKMDRICDELVVLALHQARKLQRILGK